MKKINFYTPSISNPSINSSGGNDYVQTTTKTEDYIVSKSDFGKSIRIDSSSERTITLPSMSSADDGAKITIVKLNTGKVNIVCDVNDQIVDSISNIIYNDTPDEIYAFLNLEYVYIKKLWIVFGNGTWVTE